MVKVPAALTGKTLDMRVMAISFGRPGKYCVAQQQQREQRRESVCRPLVVAIEIDLGLELIRGTLRGSPPSRQKHGRHAAKFLRVCAQRQPSQAPKPRLRLWVQITTHRLTSRATCLTPSENSGSITGILATWSKQ